MVGPDLHDLFTSLQTDSKTSSPTIVRVVVMNHLMTTPHTSTDFSDIVRDLELQLAFPDQWQRRGIE